MYSQWCGEMPALCPHPGTGCGRLLSAAFLVDEATFAVHLGREEKRKSLSDVLLKRVSHRKHAENAYVKVPGGGSLAEAQPPAPRPAFTRGHFCAPWVGPVSIPGAFHKYPRREGTIRQENADKLGS